MTYATRTSIGPGRLAWFAVACLGVAVQAGCTSALTATVLRDGIWDSSDHAATEEPEADGPQDDEAATAPEAPTPDPGAAATSDSERREAALAEAMNRLSRMGRLDAAVEAALVATLQRTQPEDWPVVVDEFATSLEASGPPPQPAAPGAEAPTAASADDPTVTPPAEPAPTPEPAPAPPPAPAPAVAADDELVDDTDEPVADDPPAADGEAAAADDEEASVAPPLAVRTACFASAVRAWGDVDRFAADRFRPGQEVIVYVELDHLASNASPAGHTTCIDAALKLVTDAGDPLHAWTFDPVAETCPGQRRDYFARYLLRIPESTPPGTCRVELAVTDTLAGTTATATLPLEVAGGAE